ncbi:hypothetical protein ACEN4P_01290 [Marinilactibacillus psychrotolerans]|uniref:Uncharacterized protein n=1 Tax=Marinilactibacillus psychrotolerans TaxID=191770 RepID=A0A5R9BWM4_9LACT|nr:hypothetical protein [Marinilactibacillus psychrotolerans]TLQ05059.1 hypothetical protein FEZ48_12855 [Marinilactibacillus psychrotolerans]GEQ34461.1 hypothetical protein B795N_23430 [Marinilactibacillus psychrotolerans]
MKLKIITGLSVISGLIYLILFQSFSNSIENIIFLVTLLLIFMALFYEKIELGTHKYTLLILYLNGATVILVPILLFDSGRSNLFKIFSVILVIGAIVIDMIWRKKRRT